GGNSAIVAGNPPEKRVERLREFWERVSSRLLAWPLAYDDNSRRIFNETSATFSAVGGVPGFFEPRVPPAVFQPQGTPEAISVYDTSPLKEPLLELVDFDLLNSGGVRLSVGAVQVLSGNMKYFDTAKQIVGPEHIMASGALPPGFPPIEIDNEPYWDGGLVSNTPLEYVLERTGPREDMVIFQVDLFSAKGCMPQTLFDIGQREKEIRYSSRTRLNTDIFRELQTIRRAIRRLRGAIPEELCDNPDWKLLDGVSCNAAVTILLLIHWRGLLDPVKRLRVPALLEGRALARGRRGRRPQLQPSRLKNPPPPRGGGQGARSHPRSRNPSQGASVMTISK